jgi:phosphoglycolate phosphatase-like HAD superfamily hydrolase
MNPIFDLIMFDLDGTLIETAPEICDAVNDTLRHFDLKAVTQQQVNDWIGHGTRELLIQALASSHNTDVASVPASVVSGDTLATKKQEPEPAGIQSCLTQFGVSRDRALFVGDSSIDVATARNAGVAVWALPHGYNMGQPIQACAPDRVIVDCSALLN